jgi:hypothetical protein
VAFGAGNSVAFWDSAVSSSFISYWFSCLAFVFRADGFLSVVRVYLVGSGAERRHKYFTRPYRSSFPSRLSPFLHRR